MHALALGKTDAGVCVEGEKVWLVERDCVEHSEAKKTRWVKIMEN